VVNPRTGDRRTVALDREAFRLLGRWLESRASLKISAQRPVFCTLEGRPLQSAYVRMLLPRLARQAGIAKRVHANAFRHTFACELLSERLPINVIQNQLGHANLAVTSRFVQRATPPGLVEAIQRRRWPSNALRRLSSPKSKKRRSKSLL
jgi:integrase/recombinase XerD